MGTPEYKTRYTITWKRKTGACLLQKYSRDAEIFLLEFLFSTTAKAVSEQPYFELH